MRAKVPIRRLNLPARLQHDPTRPSAAPSSPVTKSVGDAIDGLLTVGSGTMSQSFDNVPNPPPHFSPAERGWETALRGGQPWNAQEDADLRSGWAALTHTPDTRNAILAAQHQRGENAIASRVHLLGIDPNASREGAWWSPEDDMKLREQCSMKDLPVLAEEFRRNEGAIKSRAKKLGLTLKPPEPLKDVAIKAPKVPRVVPASAALEPRVAALCASGLPELCAKVIDLAERGVAKPAIITYLSLPAGLNSVSSHFQKAGLVWGIGGNGAHLRIVEHARVLLRNV